MAFILKIKCTVIFCMDVYQKSMNDYKDTEEGGEEDKILLEWTLVAFVNGILGISLNIIGKLPFQIYLMIS